MTISTHPSSLEQDSVTLSGNPERGVENLPPTPEEFVSEAQHGVIELDQKVAETSHLTPGSPEAHAEADLASIHIAESSVLAGAPENEVDKAIAVVVAEGTLELLGQRSTTGENPVTVLKRDGLGEDVKEVEEVFKLAYPELPNVAEAGAILEAKTQELGEHPVVIENKGEVTFIENGIETKDFSDEKILTDARERLFTPNELRKGTEIIDTETGEAFKPCFELDIESQDGELVLEKIKERRAVAGRASEIISQIESGDLQADLGNLTIAELDEVMSQLMPVKYEAEGKKAVSGTLADVYMTPADIAAMVELGKRLDNLPVEHVYPKKRSELYGLTKEALAQRVVDYAEQLIPEGTPLIHTLARDKLFNVLADGSLKTRFLLNPGNEGKLTRNGSQTQYVHFAEPGKVNPYGDTAVAVPIEEIIARSPYHQAEAYKHSRVDTHSQGKRSHTQEKMGRVTIGRENAPLALQKRIAVLRDRFENGLIAKPTQGDTNNMAFAATSESSSAARYDYPLDNTTILIEPNRIGEKQDAFLSEASGMSKAWLNEHMAPFSTDPRVLSAQMNIETRTSIMLPIPSSLTDEKGPIVAFGPVAQSIVEFGEDAVGRSVNLAKAYRDKYKEFMSSQTPAPSPDIVDAQPSVWSGAPPSDGDF